MLSIAAQLCKLRLTHDAEGRVISVVTLSLFRFAGAASRLWVLGQMALAPRALRQQAGLSFFKLCGSGTGEGFTPKPNWQVWAILAVWPDEPMARAGVSQGPVWKAWSNKAAECWTLFLSPSSVRGRWGGRVPFDAATQPDEPEATASTSAKPSHLPLAALTRASVRPRHALRFWKRVPDISTAIGLDQNVAFKIGIGEVPLLHQVTFSVWPDSAALSNFAHKDGPHARAVRAVRQGDWFSEELYARFRVLGSIGSWRDASLPGLPQKERDVA